MTILAWVVIMIKNNILYGVGNAFIFLLHTTANLVYPFTLRVKGIKMEGKSQKRPKEVNADEI